jgi:hypothetical protein
MTTADQKSAPSSAKWGIVVAGGLVLLLGLLLVQSLGDEENQKLPAQNDTITDLVGPQR